MKDKNCKQCGKKMEVVDDRRFGGRYELVWKCEGCDWKEIEQKFPAINKRKKGYW